MARNVKTVFEEHCAHLIFDRKLLKKIQTYESDFVNKNEDHIVFFGGVLMGAQPVRFTPADRNRWFDEILDVDEGGLERDLHALDAILPHRHVSSDVMNISSFWMAHRFLSAGKLSASERELGAKLCIQIIQYKFITSTLTDWFRYNADPVVAQATYNVLTKRYGLKVEGSWGALLEKRAAEVVAKNGLHYNRLIDMTNDLETVYMINDTQGRIKSILKYIRDVFTLVQNDQTVLVKNVVATIELDGEVKIRDKTRLNTQYVRYIQDTVSDRSSFIIPELLTVIAKVITTAPKSAVQETLEYMSENYSVKADKDVMRLPEVIMEHAFAYLTKNPNVMGRGQDIMGLLAKMKAIYQGSKISDPLVLEARAIGERIAKRATKSKNATLLSSIRNAILLYILIRTFTMDHYKSR